MNEPLHALKSAFALFQEAIVSKVHTETLRERFEESDLVFTVDLSNLSSLPPDWQERILRHGIEFCAIG